jgi:hypothetical protein
MTVIESVSEAKARGSTVPSARPDRKSGSIVSKYPKKNARIMAKTIVAKMPHPRIVPITNPSTSPMAHPVRQ